MRTILISGASRGIGLNIAHKELKEGNRISVGIRDLESLNGSAIDPNKWPEGKIIINHYDALKKITAENWIKNTLDEFGGFDSVINCSGVLSKVPFLYKDGDEEDILNTLNINFLAIWHLCRLSWDHLCNSRKGRILINEYDALNKISAKNWIKNTVDKFGGFDSVINCSGVLSKVPFLFKDGDEEDILNTLNINFLAIWNLCRLSWDHLCASGRGRIIVLVSMSGKRSKGDLAAYSSSKFALMGLCQTMKNKGWDKNIRVSAICPSWVNTKMAQNISSLDKSSMTQPEDIAEICSTILKLPTQSVPFEIALNCNYEI